MIDGKYIIGLTGGIGSGKSTVAAIFRKMGFFVIDADTESREVVKPGSEALIRIMERFGADVIDASGELNRGRMAEIVFSNQDERSALESILHPAIIESIWNKVKISGEKKVIIVAPLLIEAGIHEHCDLVIVVTASKDNCLKRILARDSASPEQVESRIRAQMDDRDRLDFADYVIENNSSLNDLERLTEEIIERINDRIESKRD